MSKNGICWKSTRFYREDGDKFKIEVEARLDDCSNGHNGYDYFAFTCMIWRVRRNGTLEEWGGGADTEAIAKRFPELARFVPLHLCDRYGAPTSITGCIDWYAREYGRGALKEGFRLTDQEAEILYRCRNEKDLIMYQLVKLGIIDRWEHEADECIRFLEEKTGEKYESIYAPGTQKRHGITKEDIAKIDELIAQGYYTEEQIKAREDEAIQKCLEKREQEIENDYETAVAKAEKRRAVAHYMLHHPHLSAAGKENYIYYDHRNTVAFNWKSHSKQITEEEFNEFVKNLGTDENPEYGFDTLPQGIQFEISKDPL